MRITKLILLLIFAVSCNTPRKDHNNVKGRKVSAEQESKLSQSSPVDTNRMLEIAAQDILNRLQGQQIRKSGRDESGDYYIEFKDTTNAEPNNVVWEYYLIEKNELITGKLNTDDKLDFAIRSTRGPTMGNMFELEWHIYISKNEGYSRIENDFGGGKFSNMESVTGIDKNKLMTEFRELDEETALLNDSVEIREYEILGDDLKRIK